MLDDLIALYDLNLGYARKLLADVPDEKMALQPAPGVNHAAWIIGHLARTCDVTLLQLDRQERLPAGWGDIYGRDSKSTADRARYATKDQLIAALDEGHASVKEGLGSIREELLDQPPTIERLRDRFPTRRRFVIYSLVGHEAVHLGQLSAWRRMQGYPPVM